MRMMRAVGITLLLMSLVFAESLPFPIVGSGVTDFYSNSAVINAPAEGEPFYGQDAHYQGNLPSYTDNGDGTITDNVTGLMWQQDMGEKISHAVSFVKADSLTLGGYDDWRVPSMKELYSLIQFSGMVKGATALEFFIDTAYFNQPLGDTTIGEREIDAQCWSTNQYVGLTMKGDTTVFGVNFIDGRIKGYPKYNPQTKAANSMYFRMVRGNTEYGKNSFVDNGDGTISDLATGLMWQAEDDGTIRDWSDALSYCENLTLAGKDDWHLPTVKELQSIIDYSRAPSVTSSPAIDPLFTCTEITDPGGNSGHYGFYWSGTTHLDGMVPEEGACYVAFGEAQGEMNGTLMDVHGAGSQRSDPKSGNASEYPQYWGPQGDVRYVYNYVRAVRTIGGDGVGIAEDYSVNQSAITVEQSGSQLSLNSSLQSAERITATLFHMNGRMVGLLADEEVQSGTSTLHINMENYASGVYLLQIKSSGFTQNMQLLF